ncbi:MAG TPA: NADP-specific glutamate dehydrogenase [Vicinamibacterales bacterium]|nr:NADP-specific glutamate dehydrogenase [Vicinamibacterales bacterium]
MGKLDRASEATKAVNDFMAQLTRRSPDQPEFHQAVREVAESLMPFVLERPEYQKARILDRLTEPDRIIIFRVTWLDDTGDVQINRGYRVQFSNAIGPYKGGLRFHPTVNLSVLKFLGFEQILKNSLTGLPMGGAKGGSNFDPKGKSDAEVERFCQAFMTELYRYIGDDVDVPAGDIGVGGREIGYLFGQYRRITGRFNSVLTGKGLAYGGSLIRPEATGYGCVYFVENMLRHVGDGLRGKTCVVSGSGNVATYTVEKATQLGGKVVTLSDSDGFIHDPAGIDEGKLAWVKELKEIRRGRIKEYADHFKCEFHPGKRPWAVPCQAAFPSAHENEIDKSDAEMLVKNGCKVVGEGANMPTSLEATHILIDGGVAFGPGKAANAGGVSVSGLEISQNAQRLVWSREEVDHRLGEIMKRIHERCVEYGRRPDGRVNYVDGANRAGFAKVADAMLANGAI